MTRTIWFVSVWLATGFVLPCHVLAAKPQPHTHLPFYKQLTFPDREVATYALEEVWETIGTEHWPKTRERLKNILGARLTHGQESEEVLFALAYFYLLTDYLPRGNYEDAAEEDRNEFMRWILTHPQAAGPLVFAIAPEDDAPQAIRVMYDLYRLDEQAVQKLPDLAVGFAIVLDQLKLKRALAHGQFSWLSGQRSFRLDIHLLPHELTRYLVYSNISQFEREGVHRFYVGRADMNQVYRDVIYDHDALTGKQPPRLRGRPRTIENLLVYGSTCRNQTYVAVQVGRAKGFPMAELVYHGPGVVGHCWAAQLIGSVDGPMWNIVGAGAHRFGMTYDPATGHRGSDQTLEFVGQYVRAPQQARWLSLGLTRVAERLSQWISEGMVPADDLLPAVLKIRAQPRRPKKNHLAFFKRRPHAHWGESAVVELLNQAVTICPRQPELWRSLVRFASANRLSTPAIADLIDQLAKVTGSVFPDVLYFTLLDIVEHLDEKGQEKFLDAALGQIKPEQRQRSPTLVSEIYLRAGEIFARRGEIDKAIEAYIQAIQIKPDYGPVAIPALMKLVPLLTAREKYKELLAMTDLMLAASDDPTFQLGVLPALVKGGDKQRALERLIYIVEHGDPRKRGYYTAARRAIEMLIQLDEREWAFHAAHNLYVISENLQDGRLVIRIMRKLGRDAEADEAEKRIEEAEADRLEQIEREAEARREELRRRTP